MKFHEKGGIKVRKILGVLCVLLLAFPLLAQQRTGNIIGKIVDEDGNPLPGVKVTLTGSLTAPMTTTTSPDGVFRLISLSPADDYKVKAELEGFKTTYRAPLVVVLAKNTEITLTMEMGVIEEEVTVTAASPVVESKRTQIAEHVTREALQSLPTARDPWVVLQMTPGIMVDRENIGGSESGQQSGILSKGGGYDQWSMDGALITDPASISSPTYFDFDAFDEIAITTGGHDVTIQGGGININLVTRRGSNRINLGGRFYFTDEKFQSSNLTDELKAEGVVGTNKIRNIKDYGFNMGGPLVKDKVWWWVSYGVQDIKTNVITGAADDTLLQNYAAKINLQLLPDNRIELFTHIGSKEKFGRNAAAHFPRGWHQTGKYHFGSPIYKAQVEHMFGNNIFVSAKYSYIDSGFNMIPMDDLAQNKLLYWDVGAGWISSNSYYAYNASRPSHDLHLQVNYFNDELLGMSHDIKVGFDFRQSTGTHYYSSSGNVEVYRNFNYETIDTPPYDGVPDIVPGIKMISSWRGWRDNNIVKAYAGYFSDTITLGRLALILSFRYDYQTPTIGTFVKTAVEPENGAWADNFTQGAIKGIDTFMPGLEIDPGTFGWPMTWGMKTFSPRLGATYDITGDGKTILKLNVARYGEFMGTGWADYFLPTYTGGWANFYWQDNGDGVVAANELYWTSVNTAGDYTPVQVFDANGNYLLTDAQRNNAEFYYWGDFMPDDPGNVGGKQTTFDKSVGSVYYINEAIVTLERELLPDFGAALDFTYRRFTDYMWSLPWDGTNANTMESQAWYVPVYTIPATIAGFDMQEAAGKQIYLRAAGIPNYYYRYLTERPDYYQDFMGMDLRLNKRLSNKWMFAGSFTLQTERQHWGDLGYLNGTNKWAYDGRIYAPSMGGGSGKIGMRVFSHWLLKLSGLYQLPWDFNISFSFNARQGNVMEESMNIWFQNPPNTLYRSITVPLDLFGKLRLPTYWNLNLRLEKVVRAGDYGRIYVMVDLFNVFNQAHPNRRYDYYHGQYRIYPTSTSFSANATDGRLNEILSPRVVRIGVRFDF